MRDLELLSDHYGLWLKMGAPPLHVLKERPGCPWGCLVDESDCEPLTWHWRHDWHIEEQSDMLDSGLLSAAAVLLAFCTSWSKKQPSWLPRLGEGPRYQKESQSWNALEVFTSCGTLAGVLIK